MARGTITSFEKQVATHALISHTIYKFAYLHVIQMMNRYISAKQNHIFLTDKTVLHVYLDRYNVMSYLAHRHVFQFG